MTTGRTVNKYTRVYIDGRDMSCSSRSIGPLACTFAEGVDDPLCKDITGTWLGQASISPGTLNAIFDNTSDTGTQDVLGTSGTDRDVLVALGIQAVPAAGDPVFCGQFRQDDYIVGPGETPSILTIKFSASNSAGGAAGNYSNPWGVLLHADTAVTTDNGAVGIDQLASTAFGGYMMYQVTACNGTAAVKVQDASTNENADFTDLISSGTLDFSAPSSGVVALAATATVKRYVRWQIAWGTATTITFVLAFVRNYHN